MPQSLQCFGCIHYEGAFSTGTHCKAFPSEKGVPIPDDIMQGSFDHRNEYLNEKESLSKMELQKYMKN